MTHTPLPWNISNYGRNISTVIDGGYVEIAKFSEMPDHYHGNRKDNVSFVIEAVNSYDTLQAENAKLRSALEFYENEEGYWVTQAVQVDRGKIAREALTPTTKED